MSGISFGKNNSYKPEDLETEVGTIIYVCEVCDGGNRVPLTERSCFFCNYLVKENEILS
jgi:hypothetical protein